MATASILRRAIIGVALLGAAGSAWAQTALKYKWNKGDVIHYRASQETTVNMSGAGQQATNKKSEEYLYRFEVKEAAEDGTATIDMTFASVKITMDQGEAGNATFDSTKPEAERFNGTPKLEPTLRMMGMTAGEHATVVIDAAGNVKKVEGMAKILDKMQAKATGMNAITVRNMRNVMGDEGMRNSLDQLFKVTPEKAVKADETWTATREVAIPGAPGKMKILSTLKNAGEESVNGAKAVKITSASTVEVIPPKEGESSGALPGMKTTIKDGKGTGEAYFDAAAGQLVKSTLNMSLPVENSFNEMAFKSDTTTKLVFERVANPEKTDGTTPAGN